MLSLLTGSEARCTLSDLCTEQSGSVGIVSGLYAAGISTALKCPWFSLLLPGKYVDSISNYVGGYYSE